VTVHDLILALITKSANDAAVTLAEGLAGSEALFAERMTARAWALGMRDTIFRNASGLPDPEHITSARDIAVLARALWRDFPEEYRLFATERFEWRGVVYSNHNTLMAKFPGMDGIKTGYIRESGFNLAASAVRDDRRLIGVVMGGDTAEARDAHMAWLLESAFAGRSSEQAVELAARGDSIGRQMMRVITALSPVSRAEAAPPAKAWAAAFGRFKSKTEAARRAAVVAKREEGRPAVKADGRGKSAAWRALVIMETARRARSVCRIAVRHHWRCMVEESSL
jgi:D-alanyl-D-alanine carboxypeptidase